MAMAANTMVSTPSNDERGQHNHATVRIIAPLADRIRKVGTASSSRASAAAAILRPMRICGATELKPDAEHEDDDADAGGRLPW